MVGDDEAGESPQAPDDGGAGNTTTGLWWVMQGQSYDIEKEGGYLFAAKDNLGHHANVAKLAVGDIVLDYAGAAVHAVSRVVARAVEAPRPGGPDDGVGYMARAEYHPLSEPLHLEEIPKEWRTPEAGPFTIAGKGKQVYLVPVAPWFVLKLVQRFPTRFPEFLIDALPHMAVPDVVPGGGSGTMHAPRAFDAILQALHGQGLYFPPELISNYLLALQTKRFVILTGISGTGKTQLALAVAQHLNPTTNVALQTPSDARAMEVFPYIVHDHRLVLPAAFVATLLLPPIDPVINKGSVEMWYPDGHATLTLSKDLERNRTFMSFSHTPFRKWFDEHLHAGDRFFLEAIESSDGSTSGLRLSLPKTQNVAPQEDRSHYQVTAVRPDWTDNRGLLGYYNPLTNRYAATPFLRLLIDANRAWERATREGTSAQPFFAILDEMNLARVEHYFSDFLSCLESGQPIELHDDPAIEEGENEDAVAVPRRLPIAPNLFFTGTVNVDETTSMFSPKVLDRAFTIELNQVDLAGFGLAGGAASGGGSPLSLHRFDGTLGEWRKPDTADWQAFGELLDGELRQVVIDLNDLLAGGQRHFGYRVSVEIARFVLLAREQAGEGAEVLWAALDLAILEKVLPKFHGTQGELGEILAAVGHFALTGEPSKAAPVPDTFLHDWALRGGSLVWAGTSSGAQEPRLPRTAAKVWSMLHRLQEQGFTSFVV